MHEVKWEAVDWVGEGDAVAAARGVREGVDGTCAGYGGGGALEVGVRLDDEGGAAEGVAGGLLGAHYEGVGPVAAVVDLVADAGFLGEAEVEQEIVCALLVDVFVVDVGGAD